ncbi:MAG: twin transmembrane helix small protein [Pseudomonadota bacterium]|nr:MAG: twin transmembrane helix small protein [Pseudomonadota bacterium]
MTALTIVIMLAVVATAAVLVMGIGSMAHGGKFDAEHSHQLMFARVGLQGVALLLVVIALLMSFS